MDALQQSLSSYKEQLLHIELAISSAETETDKESLFSLKSDIQQLIDLTRDSLNEIIPSSSSSNNEHDPFAKEYALFISEIEKDEIVDDKKICNNELKSLEGTKCRAPHKHQWGDTVYHNAMICSVLPSDNKNFDEIEVKVMFTNPTHKEMLPCPYYLETDCKFSVEQCRYSHGEIVQFSSLKDYVEPNFESISIGSKVLAKKPDKLWHRATIKRILKEKCWVKFDSVAKDVELDLQDVFLLDDDCGNDDDYSSVDSNDDEIKEEDIINTSLMISPSNQVLGYWEKYTKGIGSKLMTKMGYVIGTGLGRKAEGRIEPVTAVILPAGKSLDHCMKLRENAGGDEDLFNVERKLRRLQKKQEIRNQKAYEREKNKTDVFNFLNDTLAVNKANDLTLSKSEHRHEIRKETSRSLNVASLKIDEDIKRAERDLYKIKESLSRHKDVNSQIHKSLKVQLLVKQNELDTLNSRAINIHNEQSNRSDKKKLTVF